MLSQATAGKLTLPATITKKKSIKSAVKKNSFSVPKKTLAKIGASLLVLMLLAGGFLGYQRAYADKIYPKIIIAGFKVGGLTPDQAKAELKKIAAKLDEQGPEITFNDQTLKPKLSEMGVSFNLDEAVNAAFGFARQGNISQKITASWQILAHNHQITIQPKIDEEKFNGYLAQLAKVAEKEPVNASLSISNGLTTLTAPEKGRGLDKEKLKNELKSFINSGQNGKIVMVTSDLEPKIIEEDTAFARAQAEKYLSAAPITVTFENNSWTADRAEIGSWIKFSENGEQLAASVNPSAFTNWVGEQVEIAPVDKEVEDGTGAVLAEGADGRGADTKTLLAQINDALSRGQSAGFALATYAIAREQKTIYPHAQPGRFAGRYIDINLSEQTLYAFEGANLMNQFLISSGKRGYGTPTGEYEVWGKTALQKMSGPDYYLPNVPWISWFNGEISIHGTYWHDNFGTPMSHGCINASIPDAEWVYNFVEVGTPVFVHE